uniref:NADH dehydrogenase [ubiquinone] 1 alpha subcomplex subunit 12 n=1 Tax=Athene cunicularia TaxID=194338 RepID=A0A663MKY9_ATHCN
IPLLTRSRGQDRGSHGGPAPSRTQAWTAPEATSSRPCLRGPGREQAPGNCGWVNDLKTGTLIGTDKYGNKYYEDKRNFFGRHRWVIYTNEMNGKNTFWEVDGSMVPPEWHRWLHSMTDDPPTTHPPVSRKFIWENHKFNLSGTPGQYVPYSTTRKKIQEWIPPTTASK